MSEPLISTAEAVSASGFTFKDAMYAAGACISMFSAGIAFVSARRTLKRDLNSLGDSEIKIFELISKAESELTKFNVNLKKEMISKGDAFNFQEYSVELDYLSEHLLNVYDIACQRYLDDKLDKKRFEKTYRLRIGKLCANSLYKPYLGVNNFQYSALNTVNKAFNDPEK
jgi:hypothetical protein